MTKIMLISILSFLSLNSFANTTVVVKPNSPINCSSSQLNKNVNWIFTPSVVEDEKNLTVSFLTKIGNCIDGTVSYDYLNEIDVTVLTQFFNLPWKKTGFTINSELVNSDTYNVVLTINKSIAFKKHMKRAYALNISHHRVVYNWTLKLERKTSNKTFIKLD